MTPDLLTVPYLFSFESLQVMKETASCCGHDSAWFTLPATPWRMACYRLSLPPLTEYMVSSSKQWSSGIHLDRSLIKTEGLLQSLENAIFASCSDFPGQVSPLSVTSPLHLSQHINFPSALTPEPYECCFLCDLKKSGLQSVQSRGDHSPEGNPGTHLHSFLRVQL